MLLGGSVPPWAGDWEGDGSPLATNCAIRALRPLRFRGLRQALREKKRKSLRNHEISATGAAMEKVGPKPAIGCQSPITINTKNRPLFRVVVQLRPAEAEELRAVRGRKGHLLVGAVVGDAGDIRDPAWRRGQRAGLFQRETGRISRWPGNHYPALRDAGAKQ